MQRGVEADELLFHYITQLEDRIAQLEGKPKAEKPKAPKKAPKKSAKRKR